MQGKVSGSLGALQSYGARLGQSASKPSLADLARTKGKGGVEQTGAAVSVKKTGDGKAPPAEPADGAPHPKDPTVTYSRLHKQYVRKKAR